MSASDPLLPLLLAAREGDRTAAEALVRASQPRIRRLCAALGSPDDVDDLVQDTYLRALRSAEGFRGDATVLAWLCSIGRNVCADHVRKRVRQRRLLDRVTRLLPADQHTAHDHRGLGELVDALDPDRREAFVLTQIVGLSYDEAADALDCPIGTIRSRVARARADLLTAATAAERTG
jgi:RNA polymerase sigma-70 factor, ECF subfamily